jgi:hypothetical protein
MHIALKKRLPVFAPVIRFSVTASTKRNAVRRLGIHLDIVDMMNRFAIGLTA